MKRTILLAISILLILAACSRPQPIPTATATASMTVSPTQGFITSTPKPTNTPTLVETVENWNYIKPLLQYPLYRSFGTISPDGRWIIDERMKASSNLDNGKPLNTNAIISIEDPSQTINIEYDPNLIWDAYSYDFDSWSPNGLSFVGTYFGGTDFGIEGCCGTAIAITNILDDQIDSHIFRWGWSEEPGIRWLDGGTKIGLTFGSRFPDKRATWIIDTQGNLIGKYPNILNPIWADRSLLAMRCTNGCTDGKTKEIVNLDLGTGEITSIYTLEEPAWIVAYYAPKNELLLRKYYPFDNEVMILNMERMKITWKMFFSSYTGILVSPYSSRYIALNNYTVSYRETEETLSMFDWETYTITEYGKIYNWLGWFMNPDGLVVEATNRDIKIIRPQE